MEDTSVRKGALEGCAVAVLEFYQMEERSRHYVATLYEHSTTSQGRLDSFFVTGLILCDSEYLFLCSMSYFELYPPRCFKIFEDGKLIVLGNVTAGLLWYPYSVLMTQTSIFGSVAPA